MAIIKLNVTSGATVPQGVVAKGGGKKLTDYKNTAAIIFLDKQDFKKLETYPGTAVEVRNAFGKVIVTAQLTPDGPHPGVAFMPRGPWANVIIDPDTKSSGCPMYKNTEVEIEPKPELSPLEMADLMKQEYIDKL
ncbi:molybdopterin dinucleotide-binding protein [Candidatus Bathyarchaeota archaeon]|nr:molybdopterin dinucleotide-binding protein [Candidatus Bathyarchaeota archaeon]